MFPFLVIASVMFYGLAMPGSYKNMGRAFFYPPYGDFLPLSLYTTGTWHTIYGLVWIMRKDANKIYNKKFFKFFTIGSLFIYLCHDLWICVIATFIVRPFFKENNEPGPGLNFTACLLIMFFGTEILSNLNYYLFVKMFMVCCMKKKRKGKRKGGQD